MLLELAFIKWTLSQLLSKGFVPLSTPDLVRSTVVEKCGFQPRGQNTQVSPPLHLPLQTRVLSYSDILYMHINPSYIILGNHCDAWVFGAVDPHSGRASMLEV